MANTPIDRLTQTVRQQNAALRQQQAMISSLTAQVSLFGFVCMHVVANGGLANMTTENRATLRQQVAKARQHASLAEGVGDLSSFIDFFETLADD